MQYCSGASISVLIVSGILANHALQQRGALQGIQYSYALYVRKIGHATNTVLARILTCRIVQNGAQQAFLRLREHQLETIMTTITQPEIRAI